MVDTTSLHPPLIAAMKLPHAVHAFALTLCLGISLQAAALPVEDASASQPPQQRTVGEILDDMQGKFGQACQKARTEFQKADPANKDSAAMAQVLHCDCVPKAIAAAFPADVRALRMTEGEFTARLIGASDVCTAATIHRRIELACDRGLDPFAKAGELTPAPRRQARCECATSRLAALANIDPREASNNAAREYAAIVAPQPEAARPAPTYRQDEQLQQIQQTCSAADAPGK